MGGYRGLGFGKGLKTFTIKKKNSKLRNIIQGLRLRCSCEDGNEHLGSTSSEFLTSSATVGLSGKRAFSQFGLLSSGLWRQ